jgi:hypothetical protein
MIFDRLISHAIFPSDAVVSKLYVLIPEKTILGAEAWAVTIHDFSRAGVHLINQVLLPRLLNPLNFKSMASS